MQRNARFNHIEYRFWWYLDCSENVWTVLHCLFVVDISSKQTEQKTKCLWRKSIYFSLPFVTKTAYLFFKMQPQLNYITLTTCRAVQVNTGECGSTVQIPPVCSFPDLFLLLLVSFNSPPINFPVSLMEILCSFLCGQKGKAGLFPRL